MNITGVPRLGTLNGCFTSPKQVKETKPVEACYDDAKTQIQQSNSWCSTEYNANNAWNVNPGNGNVNNNNKYNANVVRPVVAFDTYQQFVKEVYKAYEDCCRGKKRSQQCIEYMAIAEDDLPCLARELWEGTYQPTVSTCFMVEYPKYREVFAANFRDRVVHHLIAMHIDPLFEERFVEQGNVSYNCRKGFGAQRAQNECMEGIKQVTCNYRQDAWIYKGDIVGFFMAIDKDIMWKKMEPFIRGKYKGPFLEKILNAVKVTIYHQPENLCVFNSDPRKWQHLSANKSLLRNGEGRGMPIGNLTTQLFANFYMSFFDDFVAQQFIFRNYAYFRFVDDFVIVCSDKKLLKSQITPMREFLQKELHLSLHMDKYYFQKASHGVEFVGAVMKNGRKYLSNRTLGQFHKKIHGFQKLMEERELTSADCQRIQASINSYLGFCKDCRTYKYRRKLLLSLPKIFFQYFYIAKRIKLVKVKTKYRPVTPF